MNWILQEEFFGLNYSTRISHWKDFTFDIRYDYDGDPSKKPECGLCLCIYFRGKRVECKLGTENTLVEYCNAFMEQILKTYAA